MRRLARRPTIALLLLTILLFVSRVMGQATPTPPPPDVPERPGDPVIKSAEDIPGVEDPMVLRAMGDHWFENGNVELADKVYAAAIDRNEANLYSRLSGEPWADALVLEWKADFDGAEKLWRKSFASDPQYTAYFLAHFSEHPKRSQLLADIESHVRELASQSAAGGQALIYVTRKGAKRFLQHMPAEEAIKAFERGERLRYVYIDKLDLSGRTWPKRVGCQRCVVGTLHGFDASFEEQFDFNGFILDELHMGKRWKGEINKSAFIPGARFKRIYLDHAVMFGPANLESIVVTGRVANLPFATFLGDTNFRNANIQGTAELRFIHFEKQASFKGTRFDGSVYMAYGSFGGLDMSRSQSTKAPVHLASIKVRGDLLIEEAKFHHGINFENARFDGDVTIRRTAVKAPTNFSRAKAQGNFLFSRNEIEDLIAYGLEVMKDTTFEDNVVNGRSAFALDALTYRVHLADPSPLHKRYKLYQGDDDAEEDLTRRSQYGVMHVRDFISRFHGTTSFANSYFNELVSFERVRFGTNPEDTVSFYNTQFGGEAHFERAEFMGMADFRTIGGRELSFNHAQFHRDWMLDDANVPGRLATTDTKMLGDAALSLAGADIRSFGVDFGQLLRDVDDVWPVDRHRLFYEHCVESIRRDPSSVTKFLDDPRLRDAKWDDQGLYRVTDPAKVQSRGRELCINRAVDEFTRLRYSFDGRSMSDEADWAYWHLKHYINHRRYAGGGWPEKLSAVTERVLFEKAFGWGVLLENLMATSIVVIMIFAVLLRLFCGEMEVQWDEVPTRYKDLPLVALIIISMHGFMGGFGNAEALVTNSTTPYKLLFTAEIVVGIIVITFFIGAYTRQVVG